MPRRSRLIAALAAFAAWLAVSPAWAQQVTEQRIQTAIDRAVAYLRKALPGLSDGQSALVAMALLKRGLSPDTPEIKAALNKIKARISEGVFKPELHHTYEAGVSLMALASADPVGNKPQIETIAKYIMSAQRPDGE